MMKRSFAVILIIILTLSVLTACGGEGGADGAVPPTGAASASPTDAASAEPTRSAGLGEAELQELGAQFDSVLERTAFEGTAYIVWNGQEIYNGGRGMADEDKGVYNSADCAYRVASITKQFTAAAVLTLCEQGKLSLDDTLGTFYPDYAAGRDLTIHSLLCMRSGVPNPEYVYPSDGGLYLTDGEGRLYDGLSPDNTAGENLDVLRQSIFSQGLQFDQDKQFDYSDTNYILLSGIVEQVSGMSCHDYVRTRFFEPLGMDDAGFMYDYGVEGTVAAEGYNRTGEYICLSYPGLESGCGDLMITPRDLYKWNAALHGGRVLSDEMYGRMTTAYSGDAAYGYGLMIGASSVGAPLYYHGGSLPSFKSFVFYVPEQDYFIAVISNYDCDWVQTVAFALDSVLRTEVAQIGDR